MKPNDSQAIGHWGEKHAGKDLKRRGMKVLGKRVRPGGRDEIDIVAREGDVLVFVEVKTRATETFGRPSDAVDRDKRRVLSRAAVRYLQRLRDPRVSFRFDVVEIVGRMDDGEPEIRHIQNAFQLDRRYLL